MNDRSLRDAARALRETADEPQARPFETRARVLRTLSARRARRLSVIRIVVPMAAVFLGSVAWASVTHKLPDAWYRFAEEIGITEGAEGNTLNTAPQGGQPSAPSPAAIIEEPAAPDEHKKAVVEPAQEPPAKTSITTQAPAERTESAKKEKAAPSSSPRPPPSSSEADDLYRAAHEAHFGGQSPGAALAAWDAYLAAAPGGRFATEAHYNRAICLVRLGRTSAARRALEPFASGAFGGYRQSEARSLLDALDGAEP